MSTDQTFEIILDLEAARRLEAQGIDLTEAILAENPALRSVFKPPEPGSRDIVSIIGATAALAPLVVPIAKELIARLLPFTDVTVETSTIDGKTTTRIQTKQA